MGLHAHDRYSRPSYELKELARDDVVFVPCLAHKDCVERPRLHGTLALLRLDSGSVLRDLQK